MTSLYNRATPSQVRILRAVEGAVKNAADAHPEYQIDRRFCRSVAKRAAGTLTAQWPDVLAATVATKLSGMAGETLRGLSGNKVLDVAPLSSAQLNKQKARGASHRLRRFPLKFLHNRLGAMAAQAKHNGDMGRFTALADALREVAKLQIELGERKP